MAELKVDRRSVRTRRALRDALAQEIEATGDLSRVTVTAVSDRADVTRRTFYSHYRDILELVSAIEDETLTVLSELVAELAKTKLDDLQHALDAAEPCPGLEDILRYFKEHGSYLRPLLGEGGDPAFAERIKTMVHTTVASRALDNIDARAVGSFFDYYLTFVISAEVGVLIRWLSGGMRESVSVMARIMTALAFVRPGDLYGTTINLNIPNFAMNVLFSKGDLDD